jgi:hypothetical protein
VGARPVAPPWRRAAGRWCAFTAVVLGWPTKTHGPPRLGGWRRTWLLPNVAKRRWAHYVQRSRVLRNRGASNEPDLSANTLRRAVDPRTDILMTVVGDIVILVRIIRERSDVTRRGII